MIEVIGPHRVTNASIEHPVIDQMLIGERVHILYSDPPWGDGNLRYWATMNKKMTGSEFKPLTYQQLLDRLQQLIERYVDGHVFIETGRRWVDQVEQMMSKCLVGVEVHVLEYASGSRMLQNMLLSGRRRADLPRGSPGAARSGYAVPKACVASVASPGAIVLDPCCGMGYTASAAIEAGMVFRGNEFNAARLRKTKARLAASQP